MISELRKKNKNKLGEIFKISKINLSNPVNLMKIVVRDKKGCSENRAVFLLYELYKFLTKKMLSLHFKILINISDWK